MVYCCLRDEITQKNEIKEYAANCNVGGNIFVSGKNYGASPFTKFILAVGEEWFGAKRTPKNNCVVREMVDSYRKMVHPSILG